MYIVRLKRGAARTLMTGLASTSFSELCLVQTVVDVVDTLYQIFAGQQWFWDSIVLWFTRQNDKLDGPMLRPGCDTLLIFVD